MTLGILSEPAADFDAANVRHGEIEENEVRGRLPRRLQCAGAGLEAHDVKPRPPEDELSDPEDG